MEENKFLKFLKAILSKIGIKKSIHDTDLRMLTSEQMIQR